MVIFVPPGDPDDPTRPPEVYDAGYQYLREMGVGEVGVAEAPPTAVQA